MFDCHVHSSFSGDSDMPAELACDHAIKLRFEGIAFTDHFDYDFPGYTDFYMVDFDKHTVFMDGLKEKYKGRLNVIKGIEVGIQPHVIARTAEKLSGYSYDFIIGAVHIIGGGDPYTEEFYIGKTKHKAYADYLEELIYMIDNFHDYDVLGHIDFISRKNNYNDRTLRYRDHSDLFDTIFKKIISAGKGIEINTGTYREKANGIPHTCFDRNIVKRYRELGGEIISLGSDAHKTEYIGYNFDYFANILLEAGFKYTTHFENRKPVFDRIQT